jgi:hypothetical protein
MNAAAVAAYSGVGTLLVAVCGAVFRALVQNIVRNEITAQNRWISNRFDKLDQWQLDHLARGHHESPRRR